MTKSLYLILTDECNLHCSFCYKGKVLRENRKGGMTPQQAEDAIEWAFNNAVLDPDDKDTAVFLWGGEPFVMYDTVMHVLERYPQINFCTNTNGVAIDEKRAGELKRHMYHLRLTLSLGSAYDKFCGITDMLADLSPIAKAVAESNGKWSVNFTVTKPKALYEDFRRIYNAGIPNILIDMPTHMTITKEFSQDFVEGYLKVLAEFSAVQPGGFKYFDSHLAEEWKDDGKRYRYCGSGVTRLLVDFAGDVYPCDGMYIVKRMNLGNIHSVVDFTHLATLKGFAAKPEIFYKYCKGCKIETRCPRAKCMGMNVELTGNMFKPDPNFCEICKAFAEIRARRHKVVQERKYELAHN